MNKDNLLRFASSAAVLLTVGLLVGIGYAAGRGGATRANPTPTDPPEMLIIVDSTGVVRDVLTPVACQWRARIRVNTLAIPAILFQLEDNTAKPWMSVMYDY